MAKTKASPDGSKDRNLVVPSGKISMTPVPIVESDTARQTTNVPVPTEFANAEDVSTLCPMAVFDENTKPGQYVSGVYQGTKEVTVEGRKAKIYLLEGGGKIVGVWGSSSLDNAFLFGDPQVKIGDKILIQFLGLVDTGKGNPAKIFRIKIAR